MTKAGLLGWDHWRARSVDADVVVELAAASGLRTPRQELITWGAGDAKLIDCISLLTRPGSRWDLPARRVVNRDFMAAARSAGHLHRMYDRSE
jgi:hypothetical protein